MEMEQKTIRTHKVGSVTVGAMMIIFGILFILHLFLPELSYMFIFRLWPCILIALGVEILLANRSNKTFVYDKGAIFLVIVLTFFAMCMAGMDYVFQNAVVNGVLGGDFVGNV